VCDDEDTSAVPAHGGTVLPECLAAAYALATHLSCSILLAVLGKQQLCHAEQQGTDFSLSVTPILLAVMLRMLLLHRLCDGTGTIHSALRHRFT
jgi:hypothetical protein